MLFEWRWLSPQEKKQHQLFQQMILLDSEVMHPRIGIHLHAPAVYVGSMTMIFPRL